MIQCALIGQKRMRRTIDAPVRRLRNVTVAVGRSWVSRWDPLVASPTG